MKFFLLFSAALLSCASSFAQVWQYAGGHANFSGNVGIGTNSPTGRLQIMGQSGFDTSTKVYITNGSSDFGRTNLILTGRLQGGNDAWAFGSAARNAIVFSSNSANSGLNIGAIGHEQFSIQHQQASNSLGFLSQTNGSAPILSMTQGGWVGIGVASPAARLHVINGAIMSSDPDHHNINVRMEGTNTPVLRFTRWNGGSNYHNAFIGQFYNSAAGSYSLGIGAEASTTGNQNAENSVITIPVSGNVGIGTMVPLAKLDVGAFIPNGMLGTVLGRLQEGNTSGAGTFLGVRGYGTQSGSYGGKSFALEHSFYGIVNSSINFYRGGGAGGGFLTFNTSENLERMRLTVDGNLAIGTTMGQVYPKHFDMI